MSMYSGKCDLADHIFGLGGLYDKDKNPVTFGQEGIGVYYSDEYRDFLEFKKQTGGVLYQHKKITITSWNAEEVEAICPQFKVIKHTDIVPDRRTKSQTREDIHYTYKYWDKEYNLKELNKKGVWITQEIKFNTLLDLIPYYPYLVCASYSNEGKSTVFISEESYVDEERNSRLKSGWYSDFWQNYKKELQDHYRDIVLRYFNPEGREHIEEITFDEKGIGYTKHPIDFNFDLEWRWEDGKVHTHWTDPKLIDESGKILMSEEDLKYLGNKMLVYYIEKKEYPIYLG